MDKVLFAFLMLAWVWSASAVTFFAALQWINQGQHNPLLFFVTVLSSAILPFVIGYRLGMVDGKGE